MQYDTRTPIGDIALHTPASMRLFESLNIDYCCGGHLPLETVCQEANLDARQVLADLAGLEGNPQDSGDPSRLAEGSLTALMAHIEAKHHAFTREELDRLHLLMEKVLRVHGAHHPELAEIARLLLALESDLRPHLEKEERILFPYIRALEGEGKACEACFGTVSGPIQVMEQEHEEAGAVLASLKRLTHGYELPPDACGSFRSLYMGIQALEEDLHRHIFLENHLLFPRAIALEASAPLGNRRGA